MAPVIRVLRLTVLLQLLSVTLAFAQRPTQLQPPGEQSDNLEPDRPDVTNGPHIVDVGLLQIEAGGIWTRSSAGHRSSSTPVTARVGLTDALEARVSTDGYLSVADSGVTARGVGNVQLGAKVGLWADAGGASVLSILPTVNLPVASEGRGLGSGVADFTLAVLTGTDVFTRGHIDVNYSIGRIGAGTGFPRFTQHLVSWSASAEVLGPVTPYLEGFWVSKQERDGGVVAAFDSGAIYVLNPRFALDGGMQIGVTGAAPSFAAFCGMSVVVGNVLGEHGVHARQRETARRGQARGRKTGR